MSKVKQVGFLGRGELGLQVLKYMVKNRYLNINFIIVCDNSPEVTTSKLEFKKIAEENSIEYFETNNINNEEWKNYFNKFNLDFCVAMLWLYTISEEIIKTTKIGFINLHPGLLPKYRGNACINWAILNNEEYHGITAHLMKGGELDSGPILVQRKYKLSKTKYLEELLSENLSESIDITKEAIEMLISGDFQIIEQNEEEALYCYPRLPRDGEINWNESSNNIFNLVRAAGRPYPGAYTFFEDVKTKEIKKMVIHKAKVIKHKIKYFAVPGHLLKFENGEEWAVATGDTNLLKLEEIEIDGKTIHPKEYFRTVRQRFGLDLGIILSIRK